MLFSPPAVLHQKFEFIQIENFRIHFLPLPNSLFYGFYFTTAEMV